MSGDHERFYDEQLAPVLLDLARRCQERGLSFLAVCEYDPSAAGMARTKVLAEGSSFAFRLVDAAVSAQGNVDALWLAVQRHATQHGHGSAFLAAQGVPVAAPTPGAAKCACGHEHSEHASCTESRPLGGRCRHRIDESRYQPWCICAEFVPAPTPGAGQ